MNHSSVAANFWRAAAASHSASGSGAPVGAGPCGGDEEMMISPVSSLWSGLAEGTGRRRRDGSTLSHLHLHLINPVQSTCVSSLWSL